MRSIAIYWSSKFFLSFKGMWNEQRIEAKQVHNKSKMQLKKKKTMSLLQSMKCVYVKYAKMIRCAKHKSKVYF